MDTESSKQRELASIRLLLWPLYVCCFASLASMRICDAMLTSLEGSFAVDQQHAAYTVSVFALAYGVLQLFFGPLGDRFGKIKVITVAALGSAVANIAASEAGSIERLILARAVSGAAAAGIVPLTMAWIGDAVDYELRQEILAKLLGATVFGTMFGQWAGGAIPSFASWRVAFLVVAVVFCAGAALTFAQARGRPPASRPMQGQFLRNTASIFRTPWSRVVLTTTMIEGCLAYSSLAFLPTHLHEAVGLPMPQAGLMIGLYGIGGLVYSRVAKTLLGHLREWGLAALGGLVLAISFGTLAVCHKFVDVLACFSAGFGFYVLHNTLQVNATQMNPEYRGTAVSLFSCCLFLGQTVGISAGALFIQRTSTSSLLLASGIGLLSTAVFFALMLRSRCRQS